MRAQTELPAIAIAFLLFTVVTVLVVGAADAALQSADRPAIEQQEATGLSEQLVSQHAPITRRANVLDTGAVAELSASDLHDQYGLSPDHDARVWIDGELAAATSNLTGGTTVERLVVIEDRIEQTLRPSFENNRSVTLPRRTPNATVDIDPENGTVVRSVRANDRVVLRNESGLQGQFDITLSRYETITLHFEVAGFLSEDDVRIEYYPAETRKATVTVTVDA